MKEETVLKLAITPHFRVSIENEDGTTTDWRLCLDYRALARIEEKTGLDLKRRSSWAQDGNLASKHYPTIVWGALQKFNPEVTADQVLDVLSPDAQNELFVQLSLLCFPDLRADYERFMANQKETGATADPNVSAVQTTA
jgi:hypothetical protein